MKSENENANMDEIISKAIGQSKPAFDFEQWKQAHPEQIAAYKEQTAGKQHKLLKYAGVALSAAAMIFLAVMLLQTSKEKDGTGDVEIAQAGSLPTFADIKLRIEMEGIAARLLAKADLIKRNPDRVPNADEHVQNEYRHIIQMYPETTTAKKAAKLIH
jgi:hypothetical protein